jgi:hypothetical protein
MTASAAEARLEGRMRADFLRGNFANCERAAKGSPTGQTVLPSIIDRLCTCSANYAADRLTPGDSASLKFGNRAEQMQIHRKIKAFSQQGLNHCKARARREAENFGAGQASESAFSRRCRQA